MWDLKCLAAATCFLTSNILFIVHGTLMMKDHHHSSSHHGMMGSSNNGAYDSNKANSAIQSTSFNFDTWKSLDPSYIESRWIYREQSRPIMMSAALFGAMAWFWLCVPIVQSAWILSKGGKRSVGSHMLLASLAVCGSIIELLARLMTVGMTNASEWLARDFNLDDWDSQGDGTGWRVLEMIHLITRGLVLWIDAFEALALFGIVVVLFHSIATEPKFRMKHGTSAAQQSISVNSENDEDAHADAASGSQDVGNTELSGTTYRSDSAPSPPPPQSAFAAVSSKVPIKPTFTKCFAYYGLFVGVLALADFVFDVLRFVNWRLFGSLAMATNALVGVIFLPIWLLILARQLPVATERFEREQKRASILLYAAEGEMTKLTGNGREIS